MLKNPGGWSCWGDAAEGERFFERSWNGEPCDRNWGGWGSTALLGFDETIDAYCGRRGGWGQHAQACGNAGLFILSLYNGYNLCRNYEWQVIDITLQHAPDTRQRETHSV